MKKRKPRTKSVELNFDGAHMFGKPIWGDWDDTPAVKKLSKRLKDGVCLGCGNKSCKCKSKCE
jgi:hypothetical protein